MAARKEFRLKKNKFLSPQGVGNANVKSVSSNADTNAVFGCRAKVTWPGILELALFQLAATLGYAPKNIIENLRHRVGKCRRFFPPSYFALFEIAPTFVLNFQQIFQFVIHGEAMPQKGSAFFLPQYAFHDRGRDERAYLHRE